MRLPASTLPALAFLQRCPLQRCAAALGALALLAVAVGPARADAVPPAIARALAPRPGWPPRFPRAPLLDRARDASGATLAWERFGTLGEGATVCVVDTGIDARHHDFRDAAGRTRVRWMVELGGAPRGEESDLERRFGAAIWSARAIDDALAGGLPLPGDRHGHGTAIASIAAGDGAGAAEREPGALAGVAPRASLVVIRTLRDGALGFEDADVVLGVELCFALAGRGESPTDAARTVALIALGGHDGAHDGSEPLEVALAMIAADGHAIVTAAGNDGSRAVHAAGRGLDGAPARVTLHLPSPREVEEPFVSLAIRTAGALAIVTPRGETMIATPGELTMTEHAGGYVVIDARSLDATRVVLGGGGAHAMLAGGDYELVIERESFDAWIVGRRLGAALGVPLFTGDHALAGDAVTIPATSPALVAVGASVSRSELGTITLEAREDGSAVLSSLGPSASGAPRPDVIAPGGVMIAALSQDLIPDDEGNLVGGSRATFDRRSVGPDRIAIEGSSASAAIVAGAYALAYALAPADRARDVALLRSTTTAATSSAESAWSPGAGAGPLRIERWLAARSREAEAGAVDLATSALALTRSVVVPGASDVVAVARLADADGRPITGGELVIRARGRELARAPIAHGVAEAPIAISWPAGETVSIEAEAQGVALAPCEIEVRVDEGPRGLARAGGGGCAVSYGSVSYRGVSHRGVSRGALGGAVVALALLSVLRQRARARVGSRGRDRRARRRPVG